MKTFIIVYEIQKCFIEKLTENKTQTHGQGTLMVWTTHFSHNLRKFKYASAGILLNTVLVMMHPMNYNLQPMPNDDLQLKIKTKDWVALQ